MPGRRGLLALATAIFLFLVISPLRPACAYPGAEILGPSDLNPPFDFSIAGNMSGFLLISDRQMAVSYSNVLKLVDMGLYALEATQPVALTVDDGTDGVIAAIAHDSAGERMLASQENGNLLMFDLNNLAAEPTIIKLVENDKLGPVVVDTSADVAYVADNTARSIHVVSLASAKLTSTQALTIPGATSFTITDAVYDANTREAYFTTSAGRIFYVSSGGAAVGRIDVDGTGAKNLAAIATTPGGGSVYAVDSTTPAVVKVSTASHAVTKSDIDISANKSPTDIVVTSVTNPTGTYAFVCGTSGTAGGISIIDTATDTVFDLGSDAGVNFEPLPVSAVANRLAASSSADGYVYMGLSSQKVGLLSANPFMTYTSITYSDGGSTLKLGQSVTITFQSDQTGTYVFKAGGDVTGSGTVLKDEAGATSGSVTADTDTAVTFKQADNSSAFAEGAGDVWVFVTSGSNAGRRATSITVDTPPPSVVIRSAGFGTGRIYVNFDRLTVADMDQYRVYIDTDPDAVRTKSDVTTTAAQASSGDTMTAEVDGLTNGTVYYIAMDAVDAGGNVSLERSYTFPDGSLAFESPEVTVGPAGLMGEKGCAVLPGEGRQNVGVIFLLLMAMAIISLRRGIMISTEGRR